MKVDKKIGFQMAYCRVTKEHILYCDYIGEFVVFRLSFVSNGGAESPRRRFQYGRERETVAILWVIILNRD
jgi:hypothetical protein